MAGSAYVDNGQVGIDVFNYVMNKYPLYYSGSFEEELYINFKGTSHRVYYVYIMTESTIEFYPDGLMYSWLDSSGHCTAED